ncbi:MAG: ABC transporter ATP-binding protein [Lachnospiraceae bacterium]|nr:ABC transporter ATP-binding protein [Lachnospiraceae bacterium]
MTGISLKNVTKAYDKNEVIKDYDLVIPEGDVHYITGPSGSGKTTLLRLIAGLEKPDKGSIEGVPERIGMVFQEDRLVETLSAVENVYLVLSRKDADRKVIKEHLLMVGLSKDQLDNPVSTFSGGMKRRVAVVRAMMSDSELVLLDEPFSGLDEDTKTLVTDYIMKQKKGRTLMIATH